MEEERAAHHRAVEQAALAERELADAHARLHDLDTRLSAEGGAAASGTPARRAGRRRPRALEARAAHPRGEAAGPLVLRPGRRPAVRTPVAVGALVIVVVAIRAAARRAAAQARDRALAPGRAAPRRAAPTATAP